MSLTTTIGAGALIGGLAFAAYAAAGPTDPVAASPPATASFAPVPTPTVTQTAESCEPPAVLTGGECLITTPGPTVVVRDPARTQRTTAPRTASPRTASTLGDDDGQRVSDDESDDERIDEPDEPDEPEDD